MVAISWLYSSSSSLFLPPCYPHPWWNPSSFILFDEMNEVPNEPPKHIKAHPLSSKTIKVSWKVRRISSLRVIICSTLHLYRFFLTLLNLRRILTLITMKKALKLPWRYKNSWSWAIDTSWTTMMVFFESGKKDFKKMPSWILVDMVKGGRIWEWKKGLGKLRKNFWDVRTLWWVYLMVKLLVQGCLIKH